MARVPPLFEHPLGYFGEQLSFPLSLTFFYSFNIVTPIFFNPNVIIIVLMVLPQMHSVKGWTSPAGEIERSPILLLADFMLNCKLILGWLSRVYLCPAKYHIIFPVMNKTSQNVLGNGL